jgi:hypothetical protein
VFLYTEKNNVPPICPNAFYESLKTSIEKRLLSSEDTDVPSCSKVLGVNTWPKNVKENILYGGEEI